MGSRCIYQAPECPRKMREGARSRVKEAGKKKVVEEKPEIHLQMGMRGERRNEQQRLYQWFLVILKQEVMRCGFGWIHLIKQSNKITQQSQTRYSKRKAFIGNVGIEFDCTGFSSICWFCIEANRSTSSNNMGMGVY